jgi:hypothetical protein
MAIALVSSVKKYAYSVNAHVGKNYHSLVPTQI